MTDKLLVNCVADAMRKVNEIEKKSKTYDDFWNDIAEAAINAYEGYKELQRWDLPNPNKDSAND